MRLFRLPPAPASAQVTVHVDGRALSVAAGLSVAAALLGHGVTPFRRTPVSGAPRAPLCMMGVCFDCLLCIDGEPNQQGCLATVREGMHIQLQDGAAQLGGE
jgi:predicted molibdopterin-dependent oxidoreductase YjgC